MAASFSPDHDSREQKHNLLTDIMLVSQQLFQLQNSSSLVLIQIILCMCVCKLSCFNRVFATLWTIAHQAPLSMGFYRQEYWSGLSCLPAGDLPNPGIKPSTLLCLPALASWLFTTSNIWEALDNLRNQDRFLKVGQVFHHCDQGGSILRLINAI